MELTYKNGFGERLVLKLIDNKVWFKHHDITDEFVVLSDEYVFDGDERIIIEGFLRMCGEINSGVYRYDGSTFTNLYSKQGLIEILEYKIKQLKLK